MNEPQAVSQAEFARILGVQRSYVTALKQAGRLVMNAIGNVLVEESKRRIAETGDPNRDDVKERHAENRGEATAEAGDRKGKTERDYKADRMKYDALSARLEYERAIGKLVEKADVEAAVADIVTAFRQGLENMPHRTAPELVGKDLDAIRVTLKIEIHGLLAEMERGFSKQLKEMGSME